MTVTPLTSPRPWAPTQTWRRLTERAWAFSPLLTLAALAHLTLIPVLAVAAIADPWTITGAPAWIKPLKFAVSIAIYTGTFIWLLSLVKGHRRLVRLVAGLTGAGLSLEMALIALQVLRGTTSHFNVGTSFDAAVFGLMGTTITVVAVMNLLLAIWLIRQRMPDPVFAWGLRHGVLISFVGMAVAFLMTAPTAEQLAAAQAGQPMTVAGAHSVGVPDGSEGLPLVGWSTTGGDLRIPHFVGLHAMQVLPLAGWVLSRPRVRARWSAPGRLSLIWTTGLGYLGLVILLTWQALRVQSILAPDSQTLAAFAGLAGAASVAAALSVRRKG